MKSEYIIWGTGWEAEKFYYQYHNKINILYFADNFNYGRKFYELPIKKPELSELRGEKEFSLQPRCVIKKLKSSCKIWDL